MLRKNPWLYEQSGSLNPAWLLLCVMLGILSIAVLMPFVFRLGEAVEIAAFSALTVSVNILLMASVSQSKAAIIANAKSTGAIAKGFGSILDHEDRA